MNEAATPDSSAPVTRLRALLKLNAGFSVLSGILLIAFAERIFAGIGFAGADELASSAVGLLVFGLVVLATAVPARTRLPLVWGIVALDFLWVLSSAGAIVRPRNALTAGGIVGIVLVAIIVGAFAVLQLRSALAVRRAHLAT